MKPLRQSKRERIIANNATTRFLAGAAPDQAKASEHLDQALLPVPPKREIRRPWDGKPVGPSEHQVQATVISWWHLAHPRYSLPEFALFAVPNGGRRDMITGALLKAEGVRAGALDLILAAARRGHHGLFIEMKVGDNKPSDKQQDFIVYLNSAGYKTAVHWDSTTAIKEIEDYLA